MKKGWFLILLGSVILIVVLAASLASGTVRAGDTVTIHYTLTLDDGTVYDSTLGREPLTTTLGQGQFIASFEEELLGMLPGEVKTFALSPEEAFGEYRTDLIGTVERSWLPESVEPQVGKRVQTEFRDGTPVIAVIKEFDDTSITLDANHPLAGRTLTFKVQLLAIGSTAPNPTTSTWLWLEVAGTLVVGAFAFLYIRKRQSSGTAKKSAGGLHKKQHLHA
jgi:FKBP-type peptidyl-prolyl cis-trans isomerase 2